MSTMNPNQKFRPYLSASEISRIIRLLKEHAEPSDSGLLQYFEGFWIKIHHGVVSPAHTIQMTKVQALGFDSVHNSMPSKEKQMHQAWIKVTANPGAATPAEIELAMEYKYVHGLMHRDEITEYERMNGFVV